MSFENMIIRYANQVLPWNVLYGCYQQYRAARVIQEAWRGKFARMEYMVYQAEILAATLIQSAWRGFVGYTDYIFTLYV
jgi:hypothetical protein